MARAKVGVGIAIASYGEGQRGGYWPGQRRRCGEEEESPAPIPHSRFFPLSRSGELLFVLVGVLLQSGSIVCESVRLTLVQILLQVGQIGRGWDEYTAEWMGGTGEGHVSLCLGWCAGCAGSVAPPYPFPPHTVCACHPPRLPAQTTPDTFSNS